MDGTEGTRAKGRARGRPRAAQTTQEVRRPGEEVGQAAPPPTVGGQVAGGNGGGGGRRTHRGVPRTDPSTGGPQVERLSSAMAAMGVVDAGGRGRSRDVPLMKTRPETCVDKSGTSGEHIKVLANYFEVLSKPKWAVHQYHVEFAPLVESPRMRRIFMRDHKDKLGGVFLFDGMSDLKTIIHVDDSIELISLRKTDNEKIRITLKHVAELAPTHPELTRLYNTQMRRNLQHLNFTLLGRHYFDPGAINTIPAYHLQVWQGVITAIRQQEEKLMMSVDTVHKVVRQETALGVISRFAETNPNNFRDLASRDLVGCVVMTSYNNKTYSIEDINWEASPRDTFETRNGPVSYITYYKNQYELNIRDMGQPLLLCKSKEREVKGDVSTHKKIYLIPELCSLTGITDQMRQDFTMLREMATRTRLDPEKRVHNLGIFIKRVLGNEKIKEEMNAWGIRFDDKLVQCNARIMPGEMIVQRDKKSSYNQLSADFSKEMRGLPMHEAKSLRNWIVICAKIDEGKARDFLSNLYRVCPPMGMQVNEPNLIVIQNDRVESFIRAFQENSNRDTELVCYIVPNNRKERYDALKKNACVDVGIPSQVIVGRTLNKKQMLMSVATKIGIQLNCKLGGEPWGLQIPFSMRIMVIGYDTYHDSAKRGRSAGAFVASLNQNLTRWYSRVSFHSTGGWQEITNSVKLNLTDALRRYNEVNKAFPELILYYRDGVGDGQVPYVMDWEVKPFKDTIQQQLQGRMPKFAFIVVNKKINTRFFYDSRKGMTNPPPGTVVDNTVTRFDRYDFFLISQSVRQGTVGPTMYNVIDDTSGLRPEHMQRLSYKLTHLYFNWQGTIRVPAPCQYAHKLAFLTGQSLHQEPKQNLCDTLFYL